MINDPKVQFRYISLPDLCALMNKAWNEVHEWSTTNALFEEEFDTLAKFDELMNEFSRRMK